MFQGMIETKQNGKLLKEYSEKFDNQLKAECWLHSVCEEARLLRIKITDHYITKINLI